MHRSPWNPEWSAAVEKVTSLVESLFACRVKFQTVEGFLDRDPKNQDPEFLEQDLVFLESTLFEPPQMIRGTQPGMFAFPLRVRRAGAPAHDVSFVGVATIEGLAASDDERLQQIGEFLQMATESRITAFERLLDIERRERELLELAIMRENAKVVPLFPRNGPRLGPDPEPFRLRTYDDEFSLLKPVLLAPTIATVGQPAAFNRVALELFNRTSLWFFVNIADLSDDAFQSAQSFRDLGRMCIFVSDLATVSIERQLRLAEVFGEAKGPGKQPGEETESDSDAPRLICAIHDDPSKLIGSGSVLPHLLELLTLIELDPSLPIHRSVQVVEAKLNGTELAAENAAENPAENAAESEAKASNLISISGRWRADDSSNPTFH